MNQQLLSKWIIKNDGPMNGSLNMFIDQKFLEGMLVGESDQPRLRFFGWDKPTVSYGYLMNTEKVNEWSIEKGNFPIVKRPTGGGIVLHNTDDLSLSLLWTRDAGILPNNPRD